MRNKKNWKRLAALVLGAALLVPAQSAYATGGQTMEPGMEAYAEGMAAEEDWFEIEDGMLKKYTGTSAEVVIPEGVEIIGRSAFYDCKSLKSVTIPEGVQIIGDYAFFNCSSLTEVKIPDSMIKIGNSAFSACGSLQSMVIPQGVNSIGGYALGFDLAYEGGKVPEFTIYGVEGSAAEMYAKVNGFLFTSGSESIVKTNIDAATVTLEESSYIYDGSPKTPAVTVKLDGKILKKGTDYILFYSSNINVGRAKAVVSGKGDYTGTVTKEFTITVKDLSQCTVMLSKSSYTYDGKAKEPTVTVKDGSRILAQNTDYIVSYSNNVNTGTAKVTVTGKENYKGTVTKEFTITKAAPGQGVKDLSQCTVMLNKSSYAYDGKAKKPTVTVRDENAVLKEGIDYTATYSNNINAGTAEVTVTGTGNYKGTVTENFTITVKTGTFHKIGFYQYKVTGTSMVSVTGANDNKVTKIIVPQTVKIGGKAFQVTAVASRAFKNNKKITSVKTGNNVKIIDASAFEGCTKLRKATLGKSITEIGRNAFKNCGKLGTITIKSMKLKKSWQECSQRSQSCFKD